MDRTSRRQQVLIVDDAPENISVLVGVLEDLCEPIVALSGSEALETAMSETPPDLILLDIMMPEIDGYEVCRLLKADDRTRDTPILFVTALGEVDDEAKGLELGAIDYITKPISAPIVRARVKNHLELKRYQDMLEDLSSIDGLTRIANRRRFDETLDTEWKRCMRSAAPLSLVLMDVDNFKEFNDNYGHVAGGDCLRTVAQTLDHSVERRTDLVAKYGGDEFVALLPDSDAESSVAVAEMLRMEIMNLDIKHSYSPVSDVVTISIGVSTIIPHAGASQEMLVKAADEALYHAKGNGRNRIETRFL